MMTLRRSAILATGQAGGPGHGVHATRRNVRQVGGVLICIMESISIPI